MAGFTVLAALTAFTLRTAHRQAGMAVALAAGMMLFFAAITQLTQAVNALESLSRQAGMEDDMLELLMKMLGMAYVTEFAVQSCRDAGEDGLAGKAALCGRLLLMGQTLPLILRIGRATLSLVP
ncbi:MAG: hypothetical protein E7324_07485 [Clostridiales bacterium]|nr:hypothetical protein [Clostridiales bacterium]